MINRVLNSIRVRYKRLVIRYKFYLGFRSSSKLKINILPWSNIAGLPGDSECLPNGKKTRGQKELSINIEDLLNHRFVIYGKIISCVFSNPHERKLLMRQFVPEVDESIFESYNPIEWHTDFFSEHQWPPQLFFQDVKMAPKSGVEIKVPRELSRFQHIGELAYSGNYHDASIEFILQVTDWIVSNPFGKGVNWECSMDVSLRAINWIWGIRFFQSIIVKHDSFNRLISNSLRDHGRHVYENLDYYGKDILTSNHYLAEIAGLIYIGAVLPDIPEADIFLAFGIQELISEMHREVLDDGMCHEASSSYHRLVAELFVSSASLIERLPHKRILRLKNVDSRNHQVKPILRPLKDSNCNFSEAEFFLPQSFYDRLSLMGDFSFYIRKPNNLVFNVGDNDSARVHKFFPSLYADSRDHDHLLATIGALIGRKDLIAAGVKAKLESDLLCGNIAKLAVKRSEKKSLVSKLKLFKNSGIVVHSVGNVWLGVSCGNSGQGGRGGHGHNDKNSFELNIDNFDFIIDGGCPYYTSFLDIRNSYRSTFAHSTLAVKDSEQNKFDSQLSGVCVLHEAANPELEIYNNEIIGKHNGFGNIHSRKFQLKNESLVITDHFDDKRKQFLLFNLHPDIESRIIDVSLDLINIELKHKAGTAVHLKIKGVKNPVLSSGFFSSGYGQITSNTLLSFERVLVETKITFEWGKGIENN